MTKKFQTYCIQTTNSVIKFVLKTDRECIERRLMRVFKIPRIPPTTVKSIRFPNDLIEDIESAIRGTGCTFTAFVVEAVRVALENLEEDEESRT